MNTDRHLTRNLYVLGATLAAIFFVVAKTPAQPFGQWDFNSGSLSATIGSDLLYSDGPGAPTALGTSFGSCSALGIPTIGGSNALVMKFPAATNAMGYFMPTPAANGGGSLVNEYTIICDLLYTNNATARPLVDTDGSLFVSGADFVISLNDGIGVTPNGPYDGVIAANTWYRVGISVTANEVHKFINGIEVGANAGTGLDGRLALTASATTSTLILAAGASGSATPGYVNSIQLRDVALNAGQMEALGGPSGGGIPQTIPPVPSFIQSRTPGVGATGIGPFPAINIVLNQGDTTISGGSIQLKMDGATLAATITPSLPTYTVSYTVPSAGRLDPNSVHTLTLTWNDSVAGNKTNTWSFTVQNYQVVNLPAPFYFENFDSLTEDPVPGVALPAGWSVTNMTAADCASCPTPFAPCDVYDLNDRSSRSYRDWILVSSGRFSGWGAERTPIPVIVLNGVVVDSLVHGNCLWTESDSRCGGCIGQWNELYTPDINCTGRTNVFVAWNSIYEQNQDNMDFIEYSVDQGTNWLPVIYYLQGTDDGQAAADIIYTNGVIDVGQTFSRIDPNQNWSPDCPAHGTNYGSYIKAPISAALIPYIQGRTNDDELDGKRIEVVRLPQADGKAKVRFHLVANGTSSWFWGIDDFGLYEINTPFITTQPSSKTINATETTNFVVAATSPTQITYQWQHAGTNLSNGGHYSGVNTATLTVSNATTNEGGSYRCILANNGGPVTSSSATLTVVDAPQIISQPLSVLVSKGYPASFSVAAIGRPPLKYQWLFNGAAISGATTTTLSFLSSQPSDAGPYQVVVTNITGAVTSLVANLSVFNGPINSNLVVHLKFDNNYSDSSGRGNNASAVGSPAFVSPGKIGTHAFSYTTFRDGSSFNYATLGYPADLHFTGATDFSVSLWTKMAPNSWADDPPYVANKNWDSGGNIGFDIGLAGGGGTFKWNYREECPHDRQDYNSPVVVTDNQWHHILVTFQRGSVARTFIDGALVDTRTIQVSSTAPPTTIDTDPAIADNQDCSGNGTRNANAVNIGQDGRGIYTDGGSMGVTNAAIDDVGIWRRALTPQEAVAVYNAGQQGKDLQQAVAASLGALTIKYVGGNVQCNWVGGTGIRLQKSPTLSPASWTDIPSTLGLSSFSEAANGVAYYRLYKP
jgi:hypothetical protein